MEADGLPVKDVLIVGGGIAGLATAIALGRRGAKTTVVERGDGALGSSIWIGARAVYALDELGILEQVQQLSDTHWKSGTPRQVFEPDGQLVRIPTPEYDDDWTLPIGVGIHRPLLAKIMQRAAREHGAELLLGHSYRSVELLSDRVVAELTTGERREFDLLIAADGVHSELRTRFFPEAQEPIYTGSMSFRMMFEEVPDEWRNGRHVAAGTTLSSRMLPGNLFYLAVPCQMERRHIEQPEAREIVRGVLQAFRPSEMFDQICERLDEVEVLVAPYEWIFVEPPWHRGRVVLIGDAVHATAPTLGMAGGMALEDAVVLAQELGSSPDLGEALAAYGARRRERARHVVQASAMLMANQQQHQPPEENAALRTPALQVLISPY